MAARAQHDALGRAGRAARVEDHGRAAVGAASGGRGRPVGPLAASTGIDLEPDSGTATPASRSGRRAASRTGAPQSREDVVRSSGPASGGTGTTGTPGHQAPEHRHDRLEAGRRLDGHRRQAADPGGHRARCRRPGRSGRGTGRPRSPRPDGLAPAPARRQGGWRRDPRPGQSRRRRYRGAMPTFDIVSQVDMQEVRNAVDQAQRELATRFDFKGTDSTVELPRTWSCGSTRRPRTGCGPWCRCSRRSWSGARCRSRPWTTARWKKRPRAPPARR